MQKLGGALGGNLYWQALASPEAPSVVTKTVLRRFHVFQHMT